MRLARIIFARNLVLACCISSGLPRDSSIFGTPPRWTICRVLLLCYNQNVISEFAAFFRRFRFHRSRWSGISVSMLGASIPNFASAFNGKGSTLDPSHHDGRPSALPCTVVVAFAFIEDNLGCALAHYRRANYIPPVFLVLLARRRVI